MRLIDESFSIFFDILRIFSTQAPIPSWKFWIHGICGITGFVNRASQVWPGKRQLTIRNHLRLTMVMQVQPRTIYISWTVVRSEFKLFYTFFLMNKQIYFNHKKSTTYSHEHLNYSILSSYESADLFQSKEVYRLHINQQQIAKYYCKSVKQTRPNCISILHWHLIYVDNNYVNKASYFLSYITINLLTIFMNINETSPW